MAMEKNELLAIMAAIIFSTQSSSDRKEDINSAVEKANEILRAANEMAHKK